MNGLWNSPSKCALVMKLVAMSALGADVLDITSSSLVKRNTQL